MPATVERQSNQEYISTAQAAALMGVSVGTIQKWMDQDILQGWRTRGGHRRLLLRSVRQFLSGHKIEGLVVPESTGGEIRLMAVGFLSCLSDVAQTLRLDAEYAIDTYEYNTLHEATMQMCVAVPDLILIDVDAFADMDMDAWVQGTLSHPVMKRTHVLIVCPRHMPDFSVHIRLHRMDKPLNPLILRRYLDDIHRVRL